jgi:RNA-binding protein NOB1
LFYRYVQPEQTKGMQYSIPKHHGGRAPDQLLRADQLLTGAWKQRASTRQTARSAFGSHITGELGMSVGTVPAEVKVGFGRNNPNAQRGRERRGKKKVSNGVTNRHNKKAGEKHLRFY